MKFVHIHSKRAIDGYLVIYLLCFSSYVAIAQEETVDKTYYFNGDISVTNNGFAFIPTFSLGAPAAIFDMSIGGKRFKFEPQFRFELEGLKPWNFVAAWRYDVVQQPNTRIRLGAQFPAYSYSKRMVNINGVDVEQVYAQRWFAPDLTVIKKITPRTSIGIFYMHGFGLEPSDQLDHADFIALRGVFQIPFAQHWNVTWVPQVYFLRMDDISGFFLYQSIRLSHAKVPLSLESLMNAPVGENNEIPVQDFDWNISLVYTFKTEFVKKK